MEHDFDKISDTAKLVAYMRSFSDIPYCSEIAAMCGAESVAKTFHNGGIGTMLKRAPLVELRYKSLSGAVAHFKAKQVVELAAGLSPRGLIMTEDPEFAYIETDLPGMIDEKQQIIKRLTAPNRRTNHRMVTANALHLTHLVSAANQLVGNFSPTAIIHEGLLPYLNDYERGRLASNIVGLLTMLSDLFSNGAWWITPDIVTREQHGRTMSVSPAAKRVAETTQRNLHDNAFEDFADAERFFIGAGFRVERFKQIDFVPNISCAITDQEVEEQIRTQEIWVMRLAV